LLLKIIKFTKNSSLNNSNRFFESNFDFKYRNRHELSILTLGIKLLRLSNRINTNCQDLNRIFDSNLIIGLDAINLLEERNLRFIVSIYC
jgi:hypothetical protein